MSSGDIFRNAKTFESLLELRDVTDGAETSTAEEAGVEFDARFEDTYVVVVDVTAIEAGSTNETYEFHVSVDSLAAFSDAPVVVGTQVYARGLGVGRIEIPISGLTVRHVDANAAAIRVGCTLGGTTPSITYGAFIAKV